MRHSSRELPGAAECRFQHIRCLAADATRAVAVQMGAGADSLSGGGPRLSPVGSRTSHPRVRNARRPKLRCLRKLWVRAAGGTRLDLCADSRSNSALPSNRPGLGGRNRSHRRRQRGCSRCAAALCDLRLVWRRPFHVSLEFLDHPVHRPADVPAGRTDTESSA